jgi:hypothetical protein
MLTDILNNPQRDATEIFNLMSLIIPRMVHAVKSLKSFTQLSEVAKLVLLRGTKFEIKKLKKILIKIQKIRINNWNKY